ncbi:MAG TPA: protoglobin domain-containing protein [Planctomycetota bacterium]
MTEHTVMVTVGIDEQEIERRKRLVGIHQHDLDRVAQVREVVERHVDQLAGAFFDYLRDADSRVPMSEQLTAEARPLKHEHLLAMVQGRYDVAYVEQRIRLALVYGRFGIETSVFLGAYHQLFANMGRAILLESPLSAADALECFLSLRRIGFFDLSLQIDVLIHERERVIREQALAIRELSTPVLQIRDRLLLMPMIGVVDAERVRMMADRLLSAIRGTRALAVVLDITGVATMQEAVASELSQAIGAARLMGTSVIITGISELTTNAIRWLPIGTDLFRTASDLQAGIEQAERMLADGGGRAAEAGAARPKSAGTM